MSGKAGVGPGWGNNGVTLVCGAKPGKLQDFVLLHINTLDTIILSFVKKSALQQLLAAAGNVCFDVCHGAALLPVLNNRLGFFKPAAGGVRVSTILRQARRVARRGRRTLPGVPGVLLVLADGGGAGHP